MIEIKQRQRQAAMARWLPLPNTSRWWRLRLRATTEGGEK
jgi:hypothetical protein